MCRRFRRTGIACAVGAAWCALPVLAHEKFEPDQDAIVVEGHRHSGIGNSDAVLRALQEQQFTRVGGTKLMKVDVRVLAASNKDLEKEIGKGHFREDLYYRLNVVPIVVPPLRERREDIPALVRHFMRTHVEEQGLRMKEVSPEAMAVFQQYEWPGNIRELENMIERLVVLKKQGIITAGDLPEKIVRRSAAPALPEQFIRFSEDGINLSREVEQYEHHLIIEALRKANGVTTRAAQLLHLNRTTLVEKLKRKGVDPRAHSQGLPN